MRYIIPERCNIERKCNNDSTRTLLLFSLKGSYASEAPNCHKKKRVKITLHQDSSAQLLSTVQRGFSKAPLFPEKLLSFPNKTIHCFPAEPEIIQRTFTEGNYRTSVQSHKEEEIIKH